jgi:hypothetical protein
MPGEELAANEVLMNFVPHIVWLGSLDVQRRYADIKDTVGDCIVGAVAAAIGEHHYEKAVKWMEQGSSIVWKQLLQLRMPLDDLRQAHSQLANDLEEVSQMIDAAALSHMEGLRNDTPLLSAASPDATTERLTTMEEVARDHRRNVARREELLAQIRRLPGFGEFLKPATFAILREAAREQLVVAINISSRQCDALVIFSSNPVIHIPLPHLTRATTKELYHRMNHSLAKHRVRRNTSYSTSHDSETSLIDLKVVLRDLWELIVGPIWERIKLIVSPLTVKKLSYLMGCLAWVREA